MSVVVTAPLTPAVTIAASANPVAQGIPVTFTPTPVNGGTPAYQWYLNGSPVSTANTYTYTPNNGDQVYVVMTTSLTCVTTYTATSTTITMTVTTPTSDNQYCTRTQNFYGNPNQMYCNGMSVTQLLNSLLQPNGGMVIGVPANNKTFTIPSSGTTCVESILPGGGQSSVLPGNYGCSNLGPTVKNNGKLNNNLLGNTIALKLNLWLDPDLGGLLFTSRTFFTLSSSTCGAPGVPGTDTSYYSINSQVFNYLGTNCTVQNIFNLANNALGGVSGLPGVNQINDAVSTINEAFSNCRFIYFIPQSKSTGISVPDKMNIGLNIVPNPFREETEITFNLSMDTKATVEIYNLIGAKIATLFNDEVTAGQDYTVRFTPSNTNGQEVMVCIVRTPAGTAVKKMILIK